MFFFLYPPCPSNFRDLQVTSWSRQLSGTPMVIRWFKGWLIRTYSTIPSVNCQRHSKTFWFFRGRFVWLDLISCRMFWVSCFTYRSKYFYRYIGTTVSTLYFGVVPHAFLVSCTLFLWYIRRCSCSNLKSQSMWLKYTKVPSLLIHKYPHLCYSTPTMIWILII